MLTLLTFTKPVYFMLFGLWAAAFVRQHKTHGVPMKRLAPYAALVVVPVVVWLIWNHTVLNKPGNEIFLPGWVNMPAQVAATAWGHSLTCPQMNPQVFDAIRTFRATYIDKGPEDVP